MIEYQPHWFPRAERCALGRLIESYQDRRGLSGTKVAEAIPMDRAAYTKYLTGERKPTPHNLARIIHVLGMDAADAKRATELAGYPGLIYGEIPEMILLLLDLYQRFPKAKVDRVVRDAVTKGAMTL